VTLEEIGGRVGEEVAISGWLEITQERIDRFAEATGDTQWIHVDPVRAASDSPFHTTIAHGFLTLSLVSPLLRDALAVDGVRMAINYGCNRVRFTAPVPAASRIRARVTPSSVDPVEGGRAIQIDWKITIERENGPRPVCIVDWLVRYYPESK
jgi:acyl dehydratase